MANAYNLRKPKSTFCKKRLQTSVFIYKRCSHKTWNVLEFDRQAWQIVPIAPFLKECPFFYDAVLHINRPKTDRLLVHLPVN